MKHICCKADIVRCLRPLGSDISSYKASATIHQGLHLALQELEAVHVKSADAMITLSLRSYVVNRLASLSTAYTLHVVSLIVWLAITSMKCAASNDYGFQHDFIQLTGAIICHGRQYVANHCHRFTVCNKDAKNRVIWILHCLAAVRGVILICFQLRAGIRRRGHANKKLLCFPPNVRETIKAFAGNGVPGRLPWKAHVVLAAFICVQILVAYVPMAANYCALYCIVGRSATYIGRTTHARTTGIGAPLARGHEHMFELFFKDEVLPDRKRNAFKNETATDFSQYYLFSVPDQMAGVSEKILIRTSASNANTVNKNSHSFKLPTRRRPPRDKRNKEPSRDETASFENKDRRWQEAQNPETASKELSPHEILNVPFNKAYVIVQKLVGKQTVLSIFNSPFMFLSFFSRPKHAFNLRQVASKVAVHVLFHASTMIQCIRSALFRQVAKSRLNALLRLAGEAQISSYVVRVPWPLTTTEVRDSFRKHQSLFGHQQGVKRFWHVFRMIRFVKDKALTFKSYFNMIKTARSMDTQSLLRESIEYRRRAWAGTTFRQLKLYHKLKVPIDMSEVMGNLMSNVTCLASRTFIPNGFVKGVAQDMYQACRYALFRLPPNNSNYLQSFVKPGPGMTLVAEDKDSCAAWVSPSSDYCRALIHLLEKESSKWQLTQYTPSQINVFRKRCFQEVHETGFGPRQHQLHDDSMPYMYGTFKSKCFTCGARTCTDDSHSCFRKIVSYALLEPGWRALFRRIARATMVMIMKLAFGDEVSSLSVSTKVLRKRFDNLQFPDVPMLSCQRCKETKKQLEVLVADAGAMYEAVDAQLIIHSLMFYVSTARQLGYIGIAVLNTPRLHGYLVRHQHHRHSNVEFILFDQLIAIHKLALSQKYVLLGNAVYKQINGVPIGGLLSKPETSLLLCGEETIWNTDFEKRAACDFKNPLPWNKQVAACRYVDDTILVSPYYCASCMLQSLSSKSQVLFDRQNKSPETASWLDVDVDCVGNSLEISLTEAESDWINGVRGLPKKFRIPPFLGNKVEDAQSRIKGIQARLHQIYYVNGKYDSNRATASIHYHMNIWYRSGYPPQYIAATWKRHLSIPMFAKAASLWGPRD